MQTQEAVDRCCNRPGCLRVFETWECTVAECLWSMCKSGFYPQHHRGKDEQRALERVTELDRGPAMEMSPTRVCRSDWVPHSFCLLIGNAAPTAWRFRGVSLVSYGSGRDIGRCLSTFSRQSRGTVNSFQVPGGISSQRRSLP